MSKPRNTPNNEKEILSSLDLELLQTLIKGILYGSITLIIQDGKVIQIEKNEKIRLV
ncbi:MAG TPA: DUF2292 domain-containing protein [Syntrophomonas sp.]|jgi:hypothetical protein|nr:DUF2292 domain-containing protein [Syntrophomonas sp.]